MCSGVTAPKGASRPSRGVLWVRVLRALGVICLICGILMWTLRLSVHAPAMCILGVAMTLLLLEPQRRPVTGGSVHDLPARSAVGSPPPKPVITDDALKDGCPIIFDAATDAGRRPAD